MRRAKGDAVLRVRTAPPTDPERLAEIAAVLRECGQAVTRTALAEQFRNETKRPPKAADLREVLR